LTTALSSDQWSYILYIYQPVTSMYEHIYTFKQLCVLSGHCCLATHVQLPSTDHYHAFPKSANTTGMLQVHKETTPKHSQPLPLRGSGAGVTPRSINDAPLDGASMQRTSQHSPSMRS